MPPSLATMQSGAEQDYMFYMVDNASVESYTNRKTYRIALVHVHVHVHVDTCNHVDVAL